MERKYNKIIYILPERIHNGVGCNIICGERIGYIKCDNISELCENIRNFSIIIDNRPSGDYPIQDTKIIVENDCNICNIIIDKLYQLDIDAFKSDTISTEEFNKTKIQFKR